MAMSLFSTGMAGRLPRLFNRRSDDDRESDADERDLDIEERERLLEAFVSEARLLRPDDVRDHASALALLERYADAYERDQRNGKTIERMRIFVQKPDVRRSAQMTEATWARIRMWEVARRYAEWRKR